MTNQEKYKEELQKQADLLSEEKISSLKYANFDEEKHIMLVGEESYRKFLSEMQKALIEENSQLEKVDLIDYWIISEYGRNKKR